MFVVVSENVKYHTDMKCPVTAVGWPLVAGKEEINKCCVTSDGDCISF